MSKPYLVPETLDALQASDDPGKLDRVSHWLAWLLLHGYGVVRLDVPPAFSSSNVSMIAAQLETAGAVIERERLKPGERGAGKGAPVRLRMSRDHHGKAVRPTKDDPPAMPAALSSRAPRVAGTPASVALEVPRARRPRPDPRLDLLRPAPITPALGAPVRVVMIAETNGHPTICLRDEAGHAWFATLESYEPAAP